MVHAKVSGTCNTWSILPYRSQLNSVLTLACTFDSIETWPNGARYEGEFENDAMHGKGTYWYPDGRRVSGAFQEGQCADDPGNGNFSSFINS